MSGECVGHQGRHVNKLIAIWLWLKKKFVVYINCSCLVIKSPFWNWDINKNKQKNKKFGLSMVPPPPSIIMGLIWKFAKILWGVIFITTISLFHFFRNSKHPEKWSVSVKNFFRGCECISSCCLLIHSNLLKNSLRKTSLFVLFELLPTALLKYVWHFVTTQHEWVNNFPGFFWKNINGIVGKLV